MINDRIRTTLFRGGTVQRSSPFRGTNSSGRSPLHILTTQFLAADEVLVQFSDGSAAIFDAEELEKLRPVPKQILREASAGRAAEHPLAVGAHA